MDEQQQHAQFQEWLPFFVNNRLGKEQRDWVEQYLATHPDAQAELQVELALRARLQSQLPEFAADAGLTAFMAKVRSEPDSKAPLAFLAFCSHCLQQCWQAITVKQTELRWVAAVSLLLAQTVVIVLLLANRTTPLFAEYAQWRSIEHTNQAQGRVLQVTFKPSASEQDIRLLLVKIQGSLIGGPGQLGNYVVKVPDAGIDSATQLIKSSGIVETVQVLSAAPSEQ